MRYNWEVAKSGRSKCMCCSFEGTPIPKGTPRLRQETGLGEGTRTDFMCQVCGEQLLKERIRDLKKLLRRTKSCQ